MGLGNSVLTLGDVHISEVFFIMLKIQMGLESIIVFTLGGKHTVGSSQWAVSQYSHTSMADPFVCACHFLLVKFVPTMMAVWSKALPLTACCLSPLPGIRIPSWACEKLPLVIGGGFRWVLRFRPPVTTG